MIQRMEIVLSMDDPCNYEEFCSDCQVAGIEPLTILEYAQKMGMLFVALKHYPNDTPKDAYLRLTVGDGKATLPTPEERKPVLQSAPQRKCCGGGKVR